MKRIPNYQDDPAQVFFWELDEFLLLAVFFGVGLLIDHLFGMMFIAWVTVRFYRKMRDRRANFFVVHWLYWKSGMGPAKSRTVPNPFIRRWF